VFAFKVNFSRSPISKAPFELDLTSTPVESSIPEAVLHRVSGKQAPPAPHKQRLLVAAAKEAKAEAKGKADPKEAKKPKAKAKGKAKCKAKSTNEAKPETSPDTPGSTDAVAEPPQPKEKTSYMLAKEKFVDKFLGKYVGSKCLQLIQVFFNSLFIFKNQLRPVSP
jgi:cell pole-organizing protein PopZ